MMPSLDADKRYVGRPQILRPAFEEWIGQASEPGGIKFSSRTVTHRFHRNGYDWDIRGTLFTPEREPHGKIGFVMTHGGAGSEMELVETPDGRPGLAAILAAHGYRVLAFSFPGHLPLSGRWEESVAARQPCYLLDRELPLEEINARNLVCTYNTVVQGAAGLVDEHMAGYDLLSFGHSTGGPISVSLGTQLSAARIIGIVGWGSGGPDGWYREWALAPWGKGTHDKTIGDVARRTVASFRQAGYEDASDLTPWGSAEDYFQWGDTKKAQFKTCLCDNQHGGSTQRLLQYSARTGLPPLEYVDHLFDPPPDYLSRLSVLLLAGENDRNHWLIGDTDAQRLETFFADKFAVRTVRTGLIVIPRFGHFGFVGRDHHLIAASWMQAIEAGFFER